MVIVALGRTEEIGASCHFLSVDGTGLVMDAGADPEVDGPEGLPDFKLIHRNADWYVDHALVSHAHHDHIGALPMLVKAFPHVQVHMTRATRDLADVVLPASARLQRRRLREGSSVHEPLFTEDEVEMHSYLYLTHAFEETFDVTGLRGGAPVKAAFYNAGHVLGAAGVLLSYEEAGTPRRLFYTSDTSLRPQTIIPGGSYPEGGVDVLMLESTLGADAGAELTTRRTEENKLADAIARVLARGGAVLLPVFAMGRAQEILALVDRFKRRGRIPGDVPVYTAGSMRAVAEVYDKSRYYTPRLDPDFQVFDVEQYRLPRNDDRVHALLREPGIFVMSSGMMFERTISNRLAQLMVGEERNGIFLVGFAREDSPAGRLLEASQAANGQMVVLDELNGPQPVRADVDRFRFSGHSHRRDLIRLVGQLQPSRVVLMHGDEDARVWMYDNVRFFYPDVQVSMLEHGVPLEV